HRPRPSAAPGPTMPAKRASDRGHVEQPPSKTGATAIPRTRHHARGRQASPSHPPAPGNALFDRSVCCHHPFGRPPSQNPRTSPPKGDIENEKYTSEIPNIPPCSHCL